MYCKYILVLDASQRRQPIERKRTNKDDTNRSVHNQKPQTIGTETPALYFYFHEEALCMRTTYDRPLLTVKQTHSERKGPDE